MAKIHEELVVIKLSRLYKDTQQDIAILAGDEVVASLEAVVQELVGTDAVVEIIKE